MTSDLLLRLKTEGNPLIDDEKVTFLWEGDIAPHLIDDMHGWDRNPQPLQRNAPELWAFSFNLPRDAYLEYAFLDSATGDRVRDPHNKRRVNNGMGGQNHFFYMPDAAPTMLVRKRKEVPQGTITRHITPTWMLADNGKRTIHLYRPPLDEPVPLLVVYDGNDYLKRGKLAVIVNNLIAEKRICPLAMAFLTNGGSRRLVEYACSEAPLAWVDHEVLPLAREELNLLDIEAHPGAYGVLGASIGGLMALYTGVRMPHIFGKILSQAGVFHFEQFDSITVDMVQHFPKRELRVWMDVGKHDFLLKSNQMMYRLLKSKDYHVSYHEFTGAHCNTAWRDDIWRGLENQFGLDD